MAAFSFTREKINEGELRKQLQDPAAGGYASFEGWVRNHNEGLPVRHLEYEAFEPLAIKEGERIVAEAIKRFGIEHAACVHRIGDLAIDHTRRRVSLGGRPLQLTPTEYRLLRTLASRADDVVTREELAQQVWGYQDASSGRTIDVHIRRLRAKLATGAHPPAIVSVRGFGYKLISDTRHTALAA